MKAIKAKLSKFQTVDEYVHGWGLYYYGAGILLPTRKTEPEGTEVSLHIRIATGETVLRGEGVVEEVRTNSEGAPVGMVIRFKRLDARSKELVQQILEHKKESRTSASVAVVDHHEEGPATEELANEDIGAIAEALDETFDSIFATGAFGAFHEGESTAPGGSPSAALDEEADIDTIGFPGKVVDPPASDASLPDGGTAVRRPPTVAAVNELLARLGLTEPRSATPHGVADHGAEPDPPSISLPDAGSAPAARDDDDADAGESDYGALGADEAGAGPGESHAAPEAAETSDIDDGFDGAGPGELSTTAEQSGDTPTLTHGDSRHSDEFHAAADRARLEAEEGEAALADAVAEVARSVTDVPVPVKPAPQGLFARFFAWLGRLFGGKS